VALILDPQRLVQDAIRAKMQRERGRLPITGRDYENVRPRDGAAEGNGGKVGAGAGASASR
jgi:hypothetical protein